MITINGKICRNLPEQVKANKDDIESLTEKTTGISNQIQETNSRVSQAETSIAEIKIRMPKYYRHYITITLTGSARTTKFCFELLSQSNTNANSLESANQLIKESNIRTYVAVPVCYSDDGDDTNGFLINGETNQTFPFGFLIARDGLLYSKLFLKFPDAEAGLTSVGFTLKELMNTYLAGADYTISSITDVITPL